jgi:hypothetical protein
VSGFNVSEDVDIDDIEDDIDVVNLIFQCNEGDQEVWANVIKEVRVNVMKGTKKSGLM